jgi:hypothetical protein
LAFVAVWLDDPPDVVATAVKLPVTFAAMLRLNTAEVPSLLIFAEVTVTGAGTNAGTKLKVAPAKLVPVTVKLETVVALVPFTAVRGETEATVGPGRNVKLLLVVAVFAPTVMEMGPVVALPGTETVRVLADAVSTVAGTPLKVTAFEAGVAPKACP